MMHVSYFMVQDLTQQKKIKEEGKIRDYINVYASNPEVRQKQKKILSRRKEKSSYFSKRT